MLWGTRKSWPCQVTGCGFVSPSFRGLKYHSADEHNNNTNNNTDDGAASAAVTAEGDENNKDGVIGVVGNDVDVDKAVKKEAVDGGDVGEIKGKVTGGEHSRS